MMQQGEELPQLSIAFPKSETELRVVFSEPVDRESAASAANYKLRSGLEIRDARIDHDEPRRIILVTEPMRGEAMQVDVLSAPGVRTQAGRPLARDESPEFIQGIATIPEIQKPAEDQFPFASRYAGKVASASCGKDGGVDSKVLIDTFGFAFIHMESGGPFNSLKIATKGDIPGLVEATRALSAGETAHVLWAGGEIQTIDGETQLVDTGFMEGSIIPPTPIRSPRPFPISAADIAGEASKTVRAKALQGVIVRYDGVTIDEVTKADEAGLRNIVFHDESGERNSAVLLANVTTDLHSGQAIGSLRGLVHQPRAGSYEVIIELDEHIRFDGRGYSAE